MRQEGNGDHKSIQQKAKANRDPNPVVRNSPSLYSAHAGDTCAVRVSRTTKIH